MHIAELFNVAGKVAVVTGGSRGIGWMIAEAYATNGMKVYISSRKAEACREAAEAMSAQGECIPVPADLSTAEGRAHLVDEVGKRERSVDVLVNNAGAGWGAPFEEYPEKGYDKTVDINVKAPFFLTQAMLPLLQAAASTDQPARVINIGSIDGIRVPDYDNYAYSPSKAAVHHMTRVMAVRLGRGGVTFNAIAPGPFESEMTKWLLEEHGERIRRMCPLGRIGSPTDMAGLALYLASPAASYLNGAIIPLDGGLCLR